jgi:hypothetical protein
MSLTRNIAAQDNPSFSAWKTKAEEMLVQSFNQSTEGMNLHIGRNTDAVGGHRVSGNYATMGQALYFETPERMLGSRLAADPDMNRETFVTRATDAALLAAAAEVKALVNTGMSQQEAQRRVKDSISNTSIATDSRDPVSMSAMTSSSRYIGRFDSSVGRFVNERMTQAEAARVNDGILQGMTTPHWDIAVIQRVFRQPFLRGYAEGMVSKVGLPNAWANLVQIFTETFEGYARVSNVAKTMQTANTSIAAKNRTGTMLSELMNLVIDYESPQVQEQAIGDMPGNWLTNAAGVGSRDAYANLMLEQLCNVLIYFGHEETGFEGLQQIAMRDGTVTQYLDAPFDDLWQQEAAGTNSTVGADLLVKLMHFVMERMEDLNFLPMEMEMRVSPIVWRVLTGTQLSRVFNQHNPLSVINSVYASQNKITQTMASMSGNAMWNNLRILPDPMLMPNTPFNPNAWDLMFLTFPRLQSALDGGMQDFIIMPEPISKMILPSAPGFRDGVVRTALKRVGSLLVPVEKVVHVVEGIGTNTWYTP